MAPGTECRRARTKVRRVVQNVLPVYLHLIYAVADGWQDRDFHAMRGVRQTNDRDAVIGCSLAVYSEF